MRTMLARLLACFAVLSSLAALGSPAHAMMAESSVSRVADEACDDGKEDVRCECRTKVRLRDWRIAFEKVCKQRDPVVFLPTVQLGADRALE